MKKVIDFFKNKIVISIIGLLALSILIWFAGPLIKFGEDNAAPLGGVVARLVVIMVLIVLWGLNNLRIQLKNKKQNDGLVGDLEANQQDMAADMSSEQTAEEMHQMNERFTEALSTLKKLKFKGRGRNQALYELPWYIIIGPPGSGKTTALVNSSLDFPLAEQFGKGAVQGIGGTRNCDWWFTNEAVLIDTAGRYTTQDSHKVVDSKAWDGFLNLLKKNRRRRPVNGAIIAISIQDLLLQTEEERIQNAKTIRMRIDELMDKLEVRFPIYLMFTKADLISGFTEYFEDLSKEDREQVWGISLPNAPQPSQSPDFDFLEKEYNSLLERLYSRQLSRIHSERDVKRRAAIQGFPQQVENLKAIVNSFVQKTFVKNRYQYQPYLRGIYFTSGTQDGTPIDRMMTSVSSNFGFGRENVQLHQSQGKSYFIGNLFREVMFPESELVGSNRKYERFVLWAQRATYAVAGLVSIGLLAAWGGSVSRNNTYMTQVGKYVDEFNSERKGLTQWNNDLRAVLPSLNALAKASIVYNQDEHPWLSGMGLYDSTVDSSADDAYHAQLKRLLLPRIVHYLETQISKGDKGTDLYNTFRVYLMFNKTEHMDKRMVMNWFENDWNHNMQGQGAKRNELEAHLKALMELQLEPYALNDKLVKTTRERLLHVPVYQRIYSRISSNPDYLRKVNMINEFGASVREVFEINPENASLMQMPYMFTKEGYDSIDLSTDSPQISDVANESWVLAGEEENNVNFVEEDLDDVTEKVKGLYFADYIRHWDRLFAGLKVKKFTSIKQATDVLAKFTDPVYSPLISILQVTSKNTTLSNQMMQNLNDDHGDGKAGAVTGKLASTFDGTKVDRKYREINVLMRESKNMPAPISSIISKLQELHEFMSEISMSPNPDKKAFDVAKARYSSGSGNAITSLRGFAKKIPQPVKGWMNDLSKESWKVVLGSGKGYVNNEWRTRVYDPYQRALSGRYPLSRRSHDELALYDFSEFFKPKGALDSFFEEFVKPFIKTGYSWKNMDVDGFSMGISSRTLAQIKRAQKIKSVFFRSNPEVPSLSFQLMPYKMDKIDARFMLEVGAQRITYNHGPKFWKSLEWSGDDDSKRVRIVFEDLSENHYEKSYDGPWAWFRLQDHSKLRSTNKSNVYKVSYYVDERGSSSADRKHTIDYLIKAKSVDNPFGENLLGKFKCPESL